MQELHKAAMDIKSLKPIQEAIVDFFKAQSWEEVNQEFGGDVNAEKLLRFAVSLKHVTLAAPD